MSHFRERFKDKISVVGRDGVQVNVTTGKVIDRHTAPSQAPVQPPAPAPAAATATAAAPRQHSREAKPRAPPAAPAAPAPVAVSVSPATPAGAVLAAPKRIVLNPEPVLEPPPPPAQPLGDMQDVHFQGALPQVGGYRAPPLDTPAQQPLPTQQQHQPSSATPTLLSDAEWLRRTADATKQQLLQLQKQLGVAQQLPSISQPTTPVSDQSSHAATSPKHNPTHGRRKKGPGEDAAPTPAPPRGGGTPQGARRTSDTSQPKYGRRSAKEAPPRSEAESVGYKPYTINEYRLINQPVRLGGLGPDDSEEKQFLRQQKQTARQYAKSVQAANHATAVAAVAARGRPALAKQPTAQQKEAAERRAKALQFAANVPKPKPVAVQEKTASPTTRIPTTQELELQSLEDQHRRDVEAIAEIKKNLGL